MDTFKITSDYIQLNQLIKAMAWSANGAEANSIIEAGLIKVNGQTEHRKRNKLVQGDCVEYKNRKVTIA